MARPGAVIGIVAVLAAASAVVYGVNQQQARQTEVAHVRALTGGDPEAGRADILRRPCGSCHEIPGIAGAVGRVGPSLTHFAGRAYIGGRASNSPDALVRWLQDPHTIDPQSAMPAMGIDEREARDIAAYLYTLQ